MLFRQIYVHPNKSFCQKYIHCKSASCKNAMYPFKIIIFFLLISKLFYFLLKTIGTWAFFVRLLFSARSTKLPLALKKKLARFVLHLKFYPSAVVLSVLYKAFLKFLQRSIRHKDFRLFY